MSGTVVLSAVAAVAALPTIVGRCRIRLGRAAGHALLAAEWLVAAGHALVGRDVAAVVARLDGRGAAVVTRFGCSTGGPAAVIVSGFGGDDSPVAVVVVTRFRFVAGRGPGRLTAMVVAGFDRGRRAGDGADSGAVAAVIIHDGGSSRHLYRDALPEGGISDQAERRRNRGEHRGRADEYHSGVALLE